MSRYHKISAYHISKIFRGEAQQVSRSKATIYILDQKKGLLTGKKQKERKLK